MDRKTLWLLDLLTELMFLAFWLFTQNEILKMSAAKK